LSLPRYLTGTAWGCLTESRLACGSRRTASHRLHLVGPGRAERGVDAGKSRRDDLRPAGHDLGPQQPMASLFVPADWRPWTSAVWVDLRAGCLPTLYPEVERSEIAGCHAKGVPPSFPTPLNMIIVSKSSAKATRLVGMGRYTPARRPSSAAHMTLPETRTHGQSAFTQKCSQEPPSPPTFRDCPTPRRRHWGAYRCSSAMAPGATLDSLDARRRSAGYGGAGESRSSTPSPGGWHGRGSCEVSGGC
jgi:hypothetical protein